MQDGVSHSGRLLLLVFALQVCGPHLALAGTVPQPLVFAETEVIFHPSPAEGHTSA